MTLVERLEHAALAAAMRATVLESLAHQLAALAQAESMLDVRWAAEFGAAEVQPRPVRREQAGRCDRQPDPAHISTSYAERQNLTMRKHMRRFTRLTNAFSKSAEHHAHFGGAEFHPDSPDGSNV